MDVIVCVCLRMCVCVPLKVCCKVDPYNIELSLSQSSMTDITRNVWLHLFVFPLT